MNQILSPEQLAASGGRLDLTDNELRTLASLLMMQARKAPQPRYLEIGVFGGGTIAFLRSVAPNVRFFGIDLFEDLITSSANTHISGNYKKDDVQAFLGDDVHLIKGDSARMLLDVREIFDLIFIDGNHTYKATKLDFELSSRVLACEGIIALHNASSWGSPDFNSYNRVDGGPWQVATELRMANDWRVVAESDRLIAFARAPR